MCSGGANVRTQMHKHKAITGAETSRAFFWHSNLFFFFLVMVAADAELLKKRRIFHLHLPWRSSGE